MTLKKSILIATAAAALTIAAMSTASLAGENDQAGSHHHITAEDRADFLDAKIAALKAGLKLTPDQEKNWAPIEAAIRDQAKEHAARIAAWLDKRGDHDKPRDLIDRLQQRSERFTTRAADIQKLIGAAKPLYDSLDDGQKRRLAILLRVIARGHHHHESRAG